VGRGQEPCADAIRSELRGLLKRVPGVVDLKFNDGSSMASVQTRDWLEPIGKAKVRRVGKDITLTAHSRMVGVALEAAEVLATEGIDAEVIDPTANQENESMATFMEMTFALLFLATGGHLLLLGAVNLRRRPLLLSGVRDAAVVGVPDIEWGEKVVAATDCCGQRAIAS